MHCAYVQRTEISESVARCLMFGIMYSGKMPALAGDMTLTSMIYYAQSQGPNTQSKRYVLLAIGYTRRLHELKLHRLESSPQHKGSNDPALLHQLNTEILRAVRPAPEGARTGQCSIVDSRTRVRGRSKRLHLNSMSTYERWGGSKTCLLQLLGVSDLRVSGVRNEAGGCKCEQGKHSAGCLNFLGRAIRVALWWERPRLLGQGMA